MAAAVALRTLDARSRAYTPEKLGFVGIVRAVDTHLTLDFARQANPKGANYVTSAAPAGAFSSNLANPIPAISMTMFPIWLSRT